MNVHTVFVRAFAERVCISSSGIILMVSYVTRPWLFVAVLTIIRTPLLKMFLKKTANPSNFLKASQIRADSRGSTV